MEEWAMTNNNKVIVNKNYLNALETVMNNSVYGKFPTAKPAPVDIDKVLKDYTKADVEATQAFVAGLDTDGDARYNNPKVEPKASEEQVAETIESTEIYRQARLAVIRADVLSPEARTAILMAQEKQVSYGLDKYPEPLNANTWDIEETIEHIMDESIDKLHYLVMLRIKLEQSLVNGAYNDIVAVRKVNTRVAGITRMITNVISDMYYLIEMNTTIDIETGAVEHLDNLDKVKGLMIHEGSPEADAIFDKLKKTIKTSYSSISANKGKLY